MLQAGLNSFIFETYIPGKDSFPHSAAMFGYHGGDYCGRTHQISTRKGTEGSQKLWCGGVNLRIFRCHNVDAFGRVRCLDSFYS